MNRLVANDHDVTQTLSAWLHRIRHSTPHTQWHRRYYENAFCIIGVERVWRFGGLAVGIFTKSFSRTQLLLFSLPARHRDVRALTTQSTCTTSASIAPWTHSATTCPLSVPLGSSNRTVRLLDGECISLLVGWTSHRSLAASQLLHLYNNPAWRTCCL